MQSLSDDEQKGILGDVMADQLKAILEYVKDIPDIKRRVESLEELKPDVKAIKLVVKDINRHQKDHEHRIKRLEIQTGL